jgi:hypothetical protein
MKKIILAILASFWCVAAFAQSSVVEYDGTVNIASGANTVTFPHGSYSHIIVKTSSSASTVYVTFNSNATVTTSNFELDSGQFCQYGIAGYAQAVPSFQYYGSGTTGTISWMAW